MAKPLAKPIRVETKFINNRLWHAVKDKYGSVAEFCRSIGRPYWQGAMGDYLHLRVSPRLANGQYRAQCNEIAAAVGLLVEDLFPDELYAAAGQNVPIATAELEFSQLPEAQQSCLLLDPAEVENPFDKLSHDELCQAIRKSLRRLTAREMRVLEWIFGINGEELGHEEIAQRENLEKSAVKGIRERALRKVREEWHRWPSLRAFDQG